MPQPTVPRATQRFIKDCYRLVKKGIRVYHLAMLLMVNPAMVASADAPDTVAVGLSESKSIRILAGEPARAAITEDRHDPFFASLSRIDAELRLGEPLSDVPPDRRVRLLKRQYRDSVRAWTDAEMGVLVEACQAVFGAAERTMPRFVPERWKFVKTDGSDEAGAAYTRHDTIILSQRKIDPALRDATPATRHHFAFLIAHETAHVFSRTHPKLRERLYARLGFRHVGPIDVGPELSSRRITNPDGPTTEHVIGVRGAEGGEFEAALFLYSKHDRYAPEFGRNLFGYVRVGLFPVERAGDGFRFRQADGKMPEGLDPKKIEAFMNQVGRNTEYIIHPDEILADNLAILLTRHLPGSTRTRAYDERLLADLSTIMAE